MNYKAAYESQSFLYLNLGQRKKSPYAQLLYIRKGIVLLRLGKKELMLEKGDTFYLPFDCLSQITPLKDAQLDRLRLSSRLKNEQNTYPEISGKVTTSLIVPILDTLYKTDKAASGKKRSVQQQKHLIDVLLDELSLCTPVPLLAPIKEDKEIKVQLECREILRQVKSGKKIDSLLQEEPALEKEIKKYTNLLK